MEYNYYRAKNLSMLGFSRLLKYSGINMGRTKLFEWMRKRGYLKAEGVNKNRPTQLSLDKGLFIEKESRIYKSNSYFIDLKVPMITRKGQSYFLNEILYKGDIENDQGSNKQNNKQIPE